MKFHHLGYIIFAVFFISCKSVPDSNYIQNINSVALEAAKNINYTTIQPGDLLEISVAAKDMDVVQPFNKNYSSTQASVGKNVAGATTYLIDSEGILNYPVLGAIETKGKTLEALRDELRQKISAYVIAPTVSVRTLNFRVTILGEVRNPGQYTLPEGKGDILSAIGLAGDLTVYAMRDNIVLVRNVDGVKTTQKFDITDANLFNSEYFRLRQNDIIYVGANSTKQKQATLDPNIGIYISVASIIVTILALVFK